MAEKKLNGENTQGDHEDRKGKLFLVLCCELMS